MAKSPGPKPTAKRRVVAAGKWYDARLDVHERLARKIKNTLEELLSAKGIQYDRVDARVKARTSFLDKASKKVNGRAKYSDPVNQIKDVVGIRVITYLESVVEEVGALIEAEFDVDASNSLDKGEALGTDRVGYRSKHYVVQLGGKRAELTEYEEFRQIPFEVQVRSLLQHAWAEMEHDRRFKYRGELPDDLKRRFSLLAAQLEAADREFDSVAREIDERAARAAREATGEDATTTLDVPTIASYLRGILAQYLPSGRVEPGLGGDGGVELLDELTRFGVTTLGQLAALFPKDFARQHPEFLREQTTFIGVLRDAMILKDATRYFGTVWSPKRWSAMSREDIEAYRAHGVDLDAIVLKYGIDVDDSDDEEIESEDSAACSFCGRNTLYDAMIPIGAGGQESPLACPRCVADMDEEARQEFGGKDNDE